MRNFQGIVFTWIQTYRKIYKSALVYLYGEIFDILFSCEYEEDIDRFSNVDKCTFK